MSWDVASSVSHDATVTTSIKQDVAETPSVGQYVAVTSSINQNVVMKSPGIHDVAVTSSASQNSSSKKLTADRQMSAGSSSSTMTIVTSSLGDAPVEKDDAVRQPNLSLVMCLAFFTFICCVWPLGLVAVIFACMTSSALEKPGKLMAARRYWTVAMGFSIASLVSGFVIVCVFWVVNHQ